MAKQIDLTRRVTAQKPAVPPKDIKPEARLRVATDVEQITDMPLAPGQIIRAPSNQPALTALERASLEQAGWKPGDPIPDSVPPQVAAFAEQIQAQPVVPPSAPKLVRREAIDISQVSPEKRAEVLGALREAAEFQRRASNSSSPSTASHAPDISSVLQQPAAAETVPEPVSMASQAIPGWRPPNDPSYRPAIPNPEAFPDLRRKAQTPPETPKAQENDLLSDLGITADQLPIEGDAEVVVELPQTAGASQATQPVETESAESAAPAIAPLDNCPHCGWPLNVPDIPEPDHAEKHAFLQSVLGQQSFVKSYSLLGGELVVRFRTLTTKEIDTIYQQVYLERERGKLLTIEDYWEKVNRYRLYLQICQLASSAFHHELPDGYSEDTNPFAQAHWKFDVPDDPRETGLPVIEEYFLREIFRTETMQRIINDQCMRFNRLVAKLESLVDNSDFWQRTGEQS